MDPLATAQQLADRLKLPPFEGEELAQVQLLLDDASDEIRAIVGQAISRTTSTVVLWADKPGRVDLPAWPVVSVDEVKYNGEVLDPASYRVRYRTLLLPVHCTRAEIEVTYTHGWDPIPNEIVKWTCVLAAAMWNAVRDTGALGMSAGMVQRTEAIDDYQLSWQSAEAAGGDSASGLTLAPRIAERLRATYGGGSVAWLEVDG